MKVLWLASWYPNRLDPFTGDFIQRHAQAASQYCEVEVIFVKKDPALAANTMEAERWTTANLTEHIIYYNAGSTVLPVINRTLSFLHYKKHYQQAVEKYIRENGKPAYVHVHVAMNAGIIAQWINKKWNIPYLVTEHWVGYYRECVPSIYDNSVLFRLLNKSVLKNARLFLPVTKGLGEKVNKDFVTVPCKVVPNAVNTVFFNYKDHRPPTFRFIHVSYMNYQKNPDGMFAAAKMLSERGYEFELFMLGNQNEMLTALALKYELLPHQVIFKNAVPYAEVAECMQEASAFFMFSRFENLPCVLLEALCCGLPVISSNVGGIAEAVNASNGILVENEDITALANAMQKMIDDYQDYDRYKIAADAAAKYSYAKVGQQIIACYE